MLKEAVLTRDEYERMFNSIVEDLRKAYVRARLIHSDLSEYNIMVWNSKHYIIDVSQAVHVTHPNAMELLRRDVSNIVRFFEKEAGIEVPPQESILKYVTSMSSDVRDQFVEF
ncbi:MAG: RIO1 family regulatory kinase/ATPase [Zestosphaera sp.]